jgi:multicomponent K+:H+ antiporter subunit E
MKRWLPYPALSAFLMIVWLVLNQSVGPGHLVLGALLGIGLGKVFGRLRPPELRLRNPHKLLILAFVVAIDIIRSNFAVAKIIIQGRSRAVTSGFVSIPLRLTDPYGMVMLACIITSTPGTIWVSYDAVHGVLLIHVLDLVDEATWIHTIGHRYERLLLEVFE